MADIQLSRPAANQTQTVTSAADARFVLNFNASEAKLAKSDNGENLIITFEDGAKIEVEGFYTAFTKDNLPTLNVGGQDITGDQLTAILGEDLMPAAGPASAGPASAGGSNATFGDPSLDGGINRLDGLDIGFSDATNLENTLEGAGVFPSPSGTVAAAGEVTPTVPVDTRPDYEMNDDHESDGGVNVLRSGSLVLNDNTGKHAAITVTGFSDDLKTAAGKYGELAQVGNNLQLNLDYDKMLTLQNEAGDPLLGGSELNNAANVKPIVGSIKGTYYAQSEGGQFSGSAQATFEVGDNTANWTTGTGNDVAWMRRNTGDVNTGDDSDLLIVHDNAGSIDAGGDADKLYLGFNSGTVNANAGDDMINVSGINTGTISGGGGNDTITVNKNNGTIENTGDTAYIDVLEGLANSNIQGGAGKETVLLRGGQSEINTNDGEDTIKLRGDDYPKFAVKYPDSAVEPEDGGHWWVDATTPVAGKLVIDDAKLAEIAAKDAHNVIAHGGADKDELSAADAANNNKLYGDAGNDTLEVFDLGHKNTLYGGYGDSTVPGGYGEGKSDGDSDTLVARRYAFDNELYGEDGNDVLVAQEFANNNKLEGGAGNDILLVQGLSYSAVNNGGIDWEAHHVNLAGNAYSNELYGGDGADKLYAASGAQNNLLDGGEGNDILEARGGNGYYSHSAKYIEGGNAAYNTEGNVLKGGEGNDELKVYDGATGNFLYGDNGADTMSVYGGAKDNKLFGGDDDAKDVLHAYGAGTDGNFLYGGAGNDELKVWEGAKGNTLEGGAGDDNLRVYRGATGNELHGNQGNDVLEVWGGDAGTRSNTLFGDAGDDLFKVQDHLKLFGTDSNTLDGGSGFDVLVERGDDGVLKNLTADKLKEFIDDGKINNIEAIITKGGKEINSVDDLLNKGWNVDSDGNISHGAGWHKDAGQGFITDAGVTYTQYHHDDGTTVLITAQLINNQGG